MPAPVVPLAFQRALNERVSLWVDSGRYVVATTVLDALYKTVLREEEVNGEKILRQFEQIIANYKHSLPIVKLVTAMLYHSLKR
ncbi:hypothetical protein CS078_15915 [Pseudomonas prosekii]|uniref:Uncharacterized protein n=1 Tax=Pseudomonas prosekii TaxID=1148509 RepID=A0A3L8CJI5_9PSED|nr:hypothetical protein CS078_15915 [Pseudomonas prosekii]RLU11772.1 hypothetical protein CS076_08975 [Pseudomonas prosekii]